MAIWQENKDLMDRLRTVQGNKFFRHQDIVSFAGMCGSRAELLRHVKRCEECIGIFAEAEGR